MPSQKSLEETGIKTLSPEETEREKKVEDIKKFMENEITKLEYDNFIKDIGVKGIDNIKNWPLGDYNGLITFLNDIIRDGEEAYKKIDKAKGAEIKILYKQASDGVIARSFKATAEKIRFGKSYYTKFYDEFEYNEKLLMSKKTGTGVKIYTSVVEMIGRLMLLISSKEAGNVAAEIDNEIIDILDHLRSENVLKSDEYETLHRDLI